MWNGIDVRIRVRGTVMVRVGVDLKTWVYSFYFVDIVCYFRHFVHSASIFHNSAVYAFSTKNASE